jgi:hypothetical protein
MYIVHSNTHVISCLVVDFIALLIQFSASVLSCLERERGGVGTHKHNRCVYILVQAEIAQSVQWQASDWKTEELWVESWQGREFFFLIFIFYSVKTYLGIHLVSWTLSTGHNFPWAKVTRSMKLTTHPHLELSLKMRGWLRVYITTLSILWHEDPFLAND